MANTITLTFAGDDKSLQKTFDAVDKGAASMADGLKDAGSEAGRFTSGLGSMNERVGNAESRFMGAADLADGLSTALGINVGGSIDMARAFGDMAGGFSATVGPAMEALSGKLGKLSAVTKAQSLATAGLNAVMAANPIFLVVAAVAALGLAFVVAYKKSETFRNIVDGAFARVRQGAEWTADKIGWMKDKIVSGLSTAGDTIKGLANVITAPYRLAFNGIASAWNSTVGSLSFKVPGWVPGVGGKGWDVPDIPTVPAFAMGGRIPATGGIVGERGPELFVPGVAGTIVPNHQLGAQVVQIRFVGSGNAWMRALRESVRAEGGNVQTVLGT